MSQNENPNVAADGASPLGSTTLSPGHSKPFGVFASALLKAVPPPNSNRKRSIGSTSFASAKTTTMMMYGAKASSFSRVVSSSADWSRRRTLRSSAGSWAEAPAIVGSGPLVASVASGSEGFQTRRKPTSAKVETSAAMMSVSSTET